VSVFICQPGTYRKNSGNLLRKPAKTHHKLQSSFSLLRCFITVKLLTFTSLTLQQIFGIFIQWGWITSSSVYRQLQCFSCGLYFAGACRSRLSFVPYIRSSGMWYPTSVFGWAAGCLSITLTHPILLNSGTRSCFILIIIIFSLFWKHKTGQCQKIQRKQYVNNKTCVPRVRKAVTALTAAHMTKSSMV